MLELPSEAGAPKGHIGVIQMFGGFGSLDWRRASDLIQRSYEAERRTSIPRRCRFCNDTLVGPVVVGAGVGLDGGWQTFFGVGSVFGRMAGASYLVLTGIQLEPAS